MQEQSTQAGREEAMDRRPEDVTAQGQGESSPLAAHTRLEREAPGSAPGPRDGSAAGEGTILAARLSEEDAGGQLNAPESEDTTRAASLSGEQGDARRDAEEGAAQYSPTEFMTPPAQEEAVHPASPDWEVAPEQPADTSGTQAQETGQNSAPPVTEDDAAHRGFLSDWSQAIRGEESPQQPTDEARLSSRSLYEAQQVAMPTHQEADPHQAAIDSASEPMSATPEPTRLAETTAAALQPGALVGDGAASAPASMVNTDTGEGASHGSLSEEADGVGSTGAAETTIPVAESAPAPGEQAASSSPVEHADAGIAPVPTAAAAPRVAPLPQRSLSELAEGQVVTGRVKNLAAFGAFVDLGLRERKDGLIHVSQLADRRIGHPSEVVQIGQEVRVRVLGIDQDKGRISLTLRGADEPVDAPTSYRTVPVAEPEPPQGEATMQSLIERFGRPQAQPSAAPQRDTRRAERERREREEILRRMRGE